MATVLQMVNQAWPKHEAEATEAAHILNAWCDQPLPSVPGLATILRLAVRIDSGKTPVEAAAREYVYRWHLALRSHVFGVPHTLGL